MLRVILLSICTILFLFSANAQLILIPDDYDNIQEGIEASDDGDTVLVAPGEYFENLNMMGKNIVLCSHFTFTNDLSDILNTVVNGSNPIHADTGSCILVISDEGPGCVIKGFTITGGSGTIWEDEHGPGSFYREGGGILIQYAAPTIQNNRLIGNEAIDDQGIVSAGGGAIRSGDGNPTILNNTFLYNLAKYGAGIVLNYSGATIKNNVIAYNSGGDDYGGAGIWSVSNGNDPVIIENNTIVYNHSNNVAGGIRLWSSNANVINNIIWGNTATSYPQVHGGNNLTYNCIEGGYTGEGNIDVDPQFEAETYILSEDSPCIDAGHTDPVFYDPEDPENPGFAMFPAKGTLHNDIGVYGGANSMEMTSVMTGLGSNQKSMGMISIYPNPAIHWIDISLRMNNREAFTIYLFDSRARIILESKRISNRDSLTTHNLDIEKLPAGIYYLKVISESFQHTQKIIKL